MTVTTASTASTTSRSDSGPDAGADLDQFVTTPSGVEICFRAEGDPSGEPIVLLAGLGQQLISWPQDLVDDLVSRDFYVIRPDNRDIGRSSRIDIKAPSLLQQTLRRFSDDQYTLGDMAEDTVAVLDALAIPRAHLVGMSMGGMLAQSIAARFRNRTLSLTSIFANTGGLLNGWVDPRALAAVIKAPAREREANADAFVATFRVIASAGFPLDEAEMRQLALDSYDRGDGARAHRGTARQIAAIYKSGDRTLELHNITAPTLVIHGDHDLMVHPSGGRATAKAIPDAHLVTIAGMGHELPRGARRQLVDLITEHALSAFSVRSHRSVIARDPVF